MTTYDTPRDADGRRLCEHCQDTPVPESLGTKPRKYCSRNCRQRAYEARLTREAITEAVAVAVARDRGTSRDDARGTSRDVPRRPSGDNPATAPAIEELPPPTPAMLADLLAPAAATAQERPRPSIPLPPPGPRRGRRMLPPPPGAQQLALGGDDQEDADGSAGRTPDRAPRRDPQG